MKVKIGSNIFFSSQNSICNLYFTLFHMFANEPVLDNFNILHHILLFGCDRTGKYESTETIKMKLWLVTSNWQFGSPRFVFICPKNFLFRIFQNIYTDNSCRKLLTVFPYFISMFFLLMLQQKVGFWRTTPF
jgi:hypothetical protein